MNLKEIVPKFQHVCNCNAYKRQYSCADASCGSISIVRNVPSGSRLKSCRASRELDWPEQLGIATVAQEAPKVPVPLPPLMSRPDHYMHLWGEIFRTSRPMNASIRHIHLQSKHSVHILVHGDIRHITRVQKPTLLPDARN